MHFLLALTLFKMVSNILFTFLLTSVLISCHGTSEKSMKKESLSTIIMLQFAVNQHAGLAVELVFISYSYL